LSRFQERVLEFPCQQKPHWGRWRDHSQESGR
jgi:hypothetical protein